MVKIHTVPHGSITPCILLPSPLPSWVLSFLGLIFLFFILHDSGKYRGAGGCCVCVMLLTVLAATCSLWPTATPHILLLVLHVSGSTLHRPLAPHSICASCLPMTGLQYERAGKEPALQYEPQPKPTYCTASKLSNFDVLQHLHEDFYD